MVEKFDAIVVGAGPAGSACACTMARAGLNTLVVERGKFPGAKNMWGGAYYGPLIHELFPRFWEEAPVERFIKRRKFSFLTGESALSVDFASGRFSKPPYKGFSVLRAKFDPWLAAQAEKAGAVIASGLQADDLLWDGTKVSGIKAGGDDIPADVVVACDGANSMLAEKAGLRKTLSPKDMKQGVKEVIQMPKEMIEQRFNLTGKEGIAWELLGTFTRDIPGGGFLYTNEDSLSVGVVVQLDALADKKIKADDILEEFKGHPEVAGYLRGGKTVEYSAHLIPVSGAAMIPGLYGEGILVAGDAAAFTLVTGLALEGANFAMASGIAAAETAAAAKESGDFSKKSLSRYASRLQESFVLKDLKTFRKAPHLLKNPRFYRQYPELLCETAEKIFTPDGLPRKKAWKRLMEAMEGRISFLQIIRDMWQIKRSV